MIFPQAIVLVRRPLGRVHLYGPFDLISGPFGADEIARGMTSAEPADIRVVPLSEAWELAGYTLSAPPAPTHEAEELPRSATAPDDLVCSGCGGFMGAEEAVCIAERPYCLACAPDEPEPARASRRWTAPACSRCGVRSVEVQTEHDGHGIYLGRWCPACRTEALRGYRADIFEAYDTDEPIEPEE